MAFSVTTAFLVVGLFQESMVPPAPRARLPRPVANTPIASVNDNRVAMGRLAGKTLTAALDIVESAYQPEGEHDPVVRILAFAEPGKAATVPGPLLRAARRNDGAVDDSQPHRLPLFMSGLRRSLPASQDTVQLRRAQPRNCFPARSHRNYFYWAALKGYSVPRIDSGSTRSSTRVRRRFGRRAAARANERVWLITEWFYDVPATKTFESALAFNGKAWPYNEQLTFTQNDSVHFPDHQRRGCRAPAAPARLLLRVTRSGGAARIP
jgi:hypothetical protein